MNIMWKEKVRCLELIVLSFMNIQRKTVCVWVKTWARVCTKERKKEQKSGRKIICRSVVVIQTFRGRETEVFERIECILLLRSFVELISIWSGEIPHAHTTIIFWKSEKKVEIIRQVTPSSRKVENSNYLFICAFQFYCIIVRE